MREKLIDVFCAALGVEPDYQNEDANKFVDELIANGVTVQEWIPANDPPKDNTENQWVIYKVGGSYFHSTGYYDGKNWRSAIADLKIQIAGWMPLPEPPKGE